MKKLAIALIALTSFGAMAKSPAQVGKEFAQVTACHFAGEYDKGTKDLLNLRIIDENRVATRGPWWKGQMNKAQKKEFRRLDDTNKLELVIMCGIVKNRYL